MIGCNTCFPQKQPPSKSGFIGSAEGTGWGNPILASGNNRIASKRPLS